MEFIEQKKPFLHSRIIVFNNKLICFFSAESWDTQLDSCIHFSSIRLKPTVFLSCKVEQKITYFSCEGLTGLPEVVVAKWNLKKSVPFSLIIFVVVFIILEGAKQVKITVVSAVFTAKLKFINDHVLDFHWKVK